MINNINIRWNDEKIEVTWNWSNIAGSEDLNIFYKKMEIIEGDGSIFSKPIQKNPNELLGKAIKNYVNEQGIYTFTFISNCDNSVGFEKTTMDIVLGEEIFVGAQYKKNSQGLILLFDLIDEVIPKETMVIEINGIIHTIDKEISSDSQFLLPNIFDDKSLKLYFKSPYDKLYKIKR